MFKTKRSWVHNTAFVCAALMLAFFSFLSSSQRGRQPIVTSTTAKRAIVGELREGTTNFSAFGTAKCLAAARCPTDGRSPVSVLYDPKTGRSDTEPRISTTFAREVLRADGRSTMFDGFRWPSLNQKQHEKKSSSECPTGKNAIISFATKYGAKELNPFAGSFQRHHSDGCSELVIFVNTVDGQAPQGMRLVSAHPNVVRFVQLSEYFAANPTEANNGKRKKGALFRVPVLRWWLAAEGSKFTRVLSIDSRDIIFFGNVFDAVHAAISTLEPNRSGTDWGLFSVAESVTFSSNSVNQVWTTLFAHTWFHTLLNRPLTMGLGCNSCSAGPFWESRGTRALTKMQLFSPNRSTGRPLPVVCSGVIGGETVAVLDFYAAFERAMQHAPPFHGIDQGVHVWLTVFGLASAMFPHKLLLLDPRLSRLRHWYLPREPIVRSRRPVPERDDEYPHLDCHLKPYALIHQLDRWDSHWADATAPYIEESDSETKPASWWPNDVTVSVVPAELSEECDAR